MLVVLDRDGVINEDSDAYIKSPDEWHAIPGSIEAVARLKRQGHTVVVATNQSGIGRGYYDLATLEAIHQKMHALINAEGVCLDGVYFCPHHPDDSCDCRKPLPGMFKQIAADFHVDWSQAVTVGDSWRDLQAARAVGCPGVLVRTGKGQRTLSQQADVSSIPVYDNLAAWVDDLS